ncbi:Armadillo [Macleaya cordata]|uniref:Armadillo n=1 Tax=Macleaya cordata TaxID=56857 RepID=A0A200QAY0_MACCD|nr:Armadillo [Macleaya cordata]
MAKYHRNNVGSLVIDRHGGGNFRLWSAFSGVAFRRKLLDTMRCGISRHRYEEDSDVRSPEQQPQQQQVSESKRNNGGSETLSEILNSSEASTENSLEETDEEAKRKIKVFEELQNVVKKFQLEEEGSQQMEAALDVRRLAKDDSEARVTLAMLGAIPPLVGMLDSIDVDFQIASLYALLNLGIGNDTNKSAIVEAGAIHKMLKLIESPENSPNPSVSEAIVANFLGLSALDSNKPVIGSSGAIPFLVKTLKNEKTSLQAKQDSFRAIYNLSITPTNVSEILETDLIPFLLNTLGDMEVSERILSILSNVVSTPEGRKGISNSSDSFPILIDVLNWTDSPGCQEKVTYILMVMAHKAYGDRQAMIEAGIASSLLELTLLGSTLSQKRASRILECLRVDKRKQISEGNNNYSGGVGAVSAPICGGSSSGPNKQDLKQVFEEEEEDMMSEEKKAVKHLVQQSLQNNMRRIVKRANLPQEFVPSDHFKSLTATSTSKSLPF